MSRTMYQSHSNSSVMHITAYVSAAAVTTCIAVYYYLITTNNTTVKKQKKHQHVENTADASLELNTVRGYRNLGNTCFLNSLIQSLCSLPQFVQYMHTIHKQSQLYTVLYNVICDNNKSTINDLYAAIVQSATQFRGFAQFDAHELYVCLLQLIDTYKAFNIDQISLNNALNDKHILDTQQRRRNPFVGLTAQFIECQSCHSKSTIQHCEFNCLTLQIPNTDNAQSYTLQQLLSYYCHTDVIDGVRCDSCTAANSLYQSRQTLKQLSNEPLKSKQHKQQLQQIQHDIHHWSAQLKQHTAKLNIQFDESDIQSKSTHHKQTNSHTDALCELSKLQPSTGTHSTIQPTMYPMKRIIHKCNMLSLLPTCLCIHINRLIGDIKLNNYIYAPLILDMSPYTATQQANKYYAADTVNNLIIQATQILYQLCGVIVHIGGSGSGHYYTYRRYSKYKQSDINKIDLTDNTQYEWSCISDHDVRSNVSYEQEVRTAKPYMLMYQRIDIPK